MLAAYPDKTAYAVCTFGYCGGPGQEPLLFQGRTEGKIVDSRGPPTFGWDAVFEYEGETYAEMDKARKVSGQSPCLASKNPAPGLKHVAGDPEGGWPGLGGG